MMPPIKKLFGVSRCMVLMAWLSVAWADTAPSPVGLWKSIDDSTGLADAEVRITLSNGELTGKLLRDLITPANEPALRCDKCTDERKGQPVVGMEIIRHAVYIEARGAWGNGEILDPEIGKTYRVEIKLLDGGRKMQVRGYWGPVFRTQIWERLL